MQWNAKNVSQCTICLCLYAPIVFISLPKKWSKNSPFMTEQLACGWVGGQICVPSWRFSLVKSVGRLWGMASRFLLVIFSLCYAALANQTQAKGTVYWGWLEERACVLAVLNSRCRWMEVTDPLIMSVDIKICNCCGLFQVIFKCHFAQCDCCRGNEIPLNRHKSAFSHFLNAHHTLCKAGERSYYRIAMFPKVCVRLGVEVI